MVQISNSQPNIAENWRIGYATGNLVVWKHNLILVNGPWRLRKRHANLEVGKQPRLLQNRKGATAAEAKRKREWAKTKSGSPANRNRRVARGDADDAEMQERAAQRGGHAEDLQDHLKE
jgi:hypothetical protein